MECRRLLAGVVLGSLLMPAISLSGMRHASVSADRSAAAVDASEAVRHARELLKDEFDTIDWRTQRHYRRILDAFRRQRIGSSELNNGLDGYAHGDLGREAIDAVYAEVLGAEAALVRSQLFSGTHAIACALFAVLRPGDTMLGVSGPPYDTLEEVIGLRPPSDDDVCDDTKLKRLEDRRGSTDFEDLPLDGSLREWGIRYRELPLISPANSDDGGNGDSAHKESSTDCTHLFDLKALDAALAADPSIRLLHVQRSCGYRWRPAIPIAEIERLCDHVEGLNEARRRAVAAAAPRGGSGGSDEDDDDDDDGRGRKPLVVFVDNCYGELVEDLEPCHVGAHLVAGSLIKNPGGTLARTGGYVAGKAELVSAAARRLSAPGVGGGATLGQSKHILQGLFMAPSTVGEALKGALLFAQVLGGEFGLPCNPPPAVVIPTNPPTTTTPPAPAGGPFASTNTRAPATPMPPLKEKGGSSKATPHQDQGNSSSASSTSSSTSSRRKRPRTDIVQMVQLGSRARLLAFCEAVQRFSPVGAHVRPTPGRTQGYGDEVVFADGTFVDGSTAELSADGPLRAPFTVFAQGGTHHMHWALVLEQVVVSMGLVRPDSEREEAPAT